MNRKEITVKQTRGTVGERQTAFVEALKAVDFEKEYQQALRDIAETVLGVEFDDNNEPIVSLNDTK
jgi:hypothetical protein